jgi:urea transport system substrate-binding protein
MPIRIGILHSLTGTMAISEKSVVDAYLLAIEEINQKGGIAGRKIEPIIVDGKSDWPTFAKEAEDLILEKKVSTIFGCWTSASRRTVKPVFEKHNHLLIYPIEYEGLEQSPNIVYMGAAPNQHTIPAVKWSFDNIGKRFFLVGSDYIYPRATNAIIKSQVTALRGEILGEEYLTLGSKNVQEVVKKIIETKPDVILNTINGDSNVAFFEALLAAGITPEKTPIFSFSLGENEINNLDPTLVKNMIGAYGVWSYFASIDSPENKVFTSKFKQKYGSDRVTSDPIQTGYNSIYIWAKAVEEAQSDKVSDILEAIKTQSINSPEGIIYIDPDTQHSWRTVRIGKLKADGQFEIVWNSEKPIRPVPYPIYKSKTDWDNFLTGFYNEWGGQWANPATKN